ncbi:ribosomal protein S5 domain protein [Ancylostoma duodenale]|uniref:Small ribosomal subunit protein uS5m n=1 Tax=Ancylostoma duodenale TaxID=51022 RepID=A0A0C2CYH4_9BILA|nr:ribosomal protein S5 domain protein [Ancylostoma duodenale]
MNTRQPVRPLNRFYRIGSSPMKVQFPGLNAPLNTKDPDVKVVEQTEEEIKEGQLSVRKTLEEQKDIGKRRFREKLHPLERGFSGTQLVGQKLGPPAPVDGVTFEDFQTYCLQVKRTSNMTGVFGRVHTMAALVITGNGKGLAGYAVGKAPLHRTTTAIVNGMNMAARKLFFVDLLEGRTIYQDFYAECRNTRVFAQRRPRGFGLTCHPRLIKICEAIGIKDIYVKVEGSTKNYLALTHAFVTGLLNQETHQQLAERKGLRISIGKRRFREKLHPLERGFSGTQLVGQKLGPPAPVDGVTFEDFQTYCLQVKRTSNMTGVFGRVHTMAALVITGNGKGLAGYAVGKAPLHRTTTAIVNGMNMAARKLFFVDLLEGRTIYQDFYAECRNTRVFAQRRPRGFGLTCHPRLIKICEAIGIKDIYVKVEGSTKNYLALTHAFVTGLHVVEMSPSRHFLPQVVASPILTPLKEEDELEDIDRLNLDDFYGEGRYPLRKPKPLPFYVNTPGHIEAEWRKHPFRNHEEVMIRLLADGVVPRWTRDERRKWSEQRHEQATAGVVQMPTGIGLSDVVAKSE